MLHPFDVICAILRARLTGEPLDRGLVAALERGEINDRELVAVASRHRVTPALAACLGDLGLDDRLPPELRDYLAFMRASNAARNRALLEQLGEIVSRFNGLGVEPCLLKGAARLIDGLYPDLSWRFMVDLDVLVPEDQLQVCVDALRANGYYEEPEALDRGEGKHYPALVSTQGPAAVELHINIAPERFRLLAPTHEVKDTSIVERSRIGNIYLLKPEYQIIYMIAHNQIFHARRFYEISMVSELVELGLSISRYEPHLDWSFILDKFAKPDWRRACLASLQAARILIGAPIPEHITPDLLIRLYLMRLLGQERFHSARVAGLVFGWFTQGFHRLSQPDRREFFARVVDNPKPYLEVLRDHLKA